MTIGDSGHNKLEHPILRDRHTYDQSTRSLFSKYAFPTSSTAAQLIACIVADKFLGIILKTMLVSESIILLAVKIYINVKEDGTLAIIYNRSSLTCCVVAVGGISTIEITICGTNNAAPEAETIVDW